MSDEECIHGLGSVSACTICNGREKREQAERFKILRTFHARYAGRCARCHDEFSVGEWIGVTASGEYVHTSDARLEDL